MRYAFLGLFKIKESHCMHIQVEDVLACSTDMHEPSSKHTSTVPSGALRQLLVSQLQYSLDRE